MTLLAGALVLAGALATAQRRRILEAVILKTLGATRRRILVAHALEYLLLAGATAVFAVILGTAAAWLAVTRVMSIAFTFLALPPSRMAIALAVALVLAFGGAGTWARLAGAGRALPAVGVEASVKRRVHLRSCNGA